MNKLDETGLEVATCRHVLAQKALNMFRGEIFGYPLFLIKNFMVPRTVKFCFADVMCKLWPFICKNEPSLTDKIRPALSVMHAKGHAIECQVRNNYFFIILIIYIFNFTFHFILVLFHLRLYGVANG